MTVVLAETQTGADKGELPPPPPPTAQDYQGGRHICVVYGCALEALENDNFCADHLRWIMGGE